MVENTSACQTSGNKHKEPRSVLKGRSARLISALPYPSLRIFAALLMPILTDLVQHALWSVIQPFAWFLFYPTVIISAWAGGVFGGILATLLSTLLVWWSFVPPAHILAKEEPRYILAAAVFLAVGVVFSIIQGRLKRTTNELARALYKARAAGRKIRAARDDLQQLIENAPDGIFITEPDGKVLRLNATAADMLQQGQEQRREVIGRPIGAFLTSIDFEHCLKATNNPLTERVHIGEQVLRRKDGSDLSVDISASIFPDGRWLISARDITERKSTERKLQQIHRANRALSRCNQALVRVENESTLLKQVCDVVVQDAGYPICWVGQAMNDEAKSVRIIAHSGLNTEYVDYLRTLHIVWADCDQGRGPTGTCIRTREVVACQNITSAPEMDPWRVQAKRYGYASSIAIPLLVADEVFGALNIYAFDADEFRTEEVALLKELADDLAFGISALRSRAHQKQAEAELLKLNTELEDRVQARTSELQQAREREFETGSKIQKTLLIDQPPAHLPGIQIATLAIPTERIDGDFIFFLEPRERSFDVIVGDVMGKGIQAALLSAATKTHFLKALGQLSVLAEPDQLPKTEDIVMLAHAEIATQLVELESFVTLSYVRIDPLRGIAELVDCGHTGMIQLHGRTGKGDLLRGDNLPLGVREDEIYRQKEIPLQAGDLLFLFSDGVTEARSSTGDLFGVDRLIRCIEEHPTLEPTSLIENLRKAVGAHCGCGHLADDLTMVAIRLNEVGPPIAKAGLKVSSDLCELRHIREFIRSFCSERPMNLLDEDNISALELAINETASNIMKHAYHGRANHEIHVEAEAYSGRLAVRLCHCGCAFSQPPANLSLDTPRESGLGLYMVSQCVDEVHYYQDERGRNCVSLTKLLMKQR